MNCNEFQHWLLTRDVFGSETPEALLHLKICETCKRLYVMDTSLEKNIQSVFFQQEVPKKLAGRIDLALDQAKGPARMNKAGITALAAGIAFILILAVFIRSNQPFRYQSLDHLSQSAITSHLKGNTSVSFNAEKMGDALATLGKELKFNVVVPDLSEQGYTLIGGRLCFLDTCRTAYIFYRKNGKTCSLFILDKNSLDFEMADGMKYSNNQREYRSDIWKDHDQVYIMVYQT